MATPPGKGAIALVRVSGPNAVPLLTRHFPPAQNGLPARSPRLGRFLDGQGRLLDRVLVTLFPAPASYTGEDVVEISCHGGPFLARRILEVLLESGARLAEPGEFTLRAFLNGKMDLTQAEAVRDLIESRTGFQARVAAEQLEGKLSKALQPLRQELIRVLSHLETAVEFVEDEVAPDSREELLASLQVVEAELGRLAESFHFGKVLHDGLAVTIAGRPNAGKSSVFNRLLCEDRAIVTEIPGTTRDALTEWINLQGIPVRLADTAGIREGAERVEGLGIEKSLEYIQQADLILFVVDGAEPFDDQDLYIWGKVRRRPCLLLVNKEDLPRRAEIPAEVQGGVLEVLTVSALLGTGFSELREAICKAAVPERGGEEERIVVTNLRHRRCLEEAREQLREGMEAYRAGLSEEFPLYHFRKTLTTLGQITGEITVEDILTEIFSTFCIGK